MGPFWGSEATQCSWSNHRNGRRLLRQPTDEVSQTHSDPRAGVFDRRSPAERLCAHPALAGYIRSRPRVSACGRGTLTKHDNYWEFMGELFQMAKKNATGADAVIDSVLNELTRKLVREQSTTAGAGSRFASVLQVPVIVWFLAPARHSGRRKLLLRPCAGQKGASSGGAVAQKRGKA